MNSKPKSIVWKYYNVSEDKLAICKYCKIASFKNNSTRMSIHLAKCTKCPPSIRNMFLKSSSTKTALLTKKVHNRDQELRHVSDKENKNSEVDAEELGASCQFPTFVDHMSKEEQVNCNIFYLQMLNANKVYHITIRNHVEEQLRKPYSEVVAL